MILVINYCSFLDIFHILKHISQKKKLEYLTLVIYSLYNNAPVPNFRTSYIFTTFTVCIFVTFVHQKFRTLSVNTNVNPESYYHLKGFIYYVRHVYRHCWTSTLTHILWLPCGMSQHSKICFDIFLMDVKR